MSELGRNRLSSTSDCKLRRLLYSDRTEVDNCREADLACYELRAVSFLENDNGIRYKDIDNFDRRLKATLTDAINLAVVPTSFENNQDPDALKSHFWKKGHLFFSDLRATSSSARVIPRKFDP
jgi:hypothetical protein